MKNESREPGLFLNGVYEGTLEDIIKAQIEKADLSYFLQPYSTGLIRPLADNIPTTLNPLPLFLSTTKDCGEVAYIAEIVNWEDKRNIVDSRLNVINKQLKKYQPSEENGCYLETDTGKSYVNLISIINLQKLENPFRVGNLIKISNNEPYKERTRSGGTSAVYYDSNLFDLRKKTSSYKEKLIVELQKELEQEALYEGGNKTRLVKVAKRNPMARQQCIEHYGYKCSVCSFDFEKVYGTIGEKYIHVHHIIPLSEIKKEYKIDPIKDLVPVCPNCHAIIHKTNPVLTVEELKKHITK